jgi:plastocyanin
MREILLCLYRASRTETSLLVFYAGTLPGTRKTECNLFFAVNKTRAHSADAEPNRFFPVHDQNSPGSSLLSQLLIGISGPDGNGPDRSLIMDRQYLFTITAHYGNMSKYSRLALCSACIALLILACMVAGCTSYQTPAAPTATAAPPASAGQGNSITIKNFAFDPSTLTVKTGTAVTWTNQDSAPHIVVSDTGSPAAFSSDSLSTGASYKFTFAQPGTYTYHCSIHPSMKGTIIVQS